jgi:spermidine synthase
MLVRIENDLYRGKTKYQSMRIFDTYQFGRMLTLDNLIMLSESDERHYHEMLVHVAMFTHRNPRDVLVIGGGDGGSVREVLRHPSVRKVDLVEIDGKVIELSRKFLPTLSAKLSSPKVHIFVEDGIEYVKKAPTACYDVIIVDSTDPIGPAIGLFKRNFYRDCLRTLCADGILTAQIGSPFYFPKRVRPALLALRNVFSITKPYMVHIPTYCDGFYCMVFCSRTVDPLVHFQQKRFEKLRLNMRYYNEEIHRGAFMIPTYVKNLFSK